MGKIKFFLRYMYLLGRKHTRSQLLRPKSIPMVIINFNQLFYLQQLINFLIERKFENIVVIDNKSTYPPLLNYYKAIKDRVTVEFMDANYGHMVFFESKELQKKYGQGFYAVTDADIVPNNALPENFMSTLLKLLIKYYNKITKVGFALDINDIPDSFPLKGRVIRNEQMFWEEKIGENLYKASIDTTFALYKPEYPVNNHGLKFLQGIRTAGNFTAKHGGWYIDPKNYTEEQLYYIKTADRSSSWKLDEQGKSDNKGTANYY